MSVIFKCSLIALTALLTDEHMWYKYFARRCSSIDPIKEVVMKMSIIVNDGTSLFGCYFWLRNRHVLG